MVKNLDVNKEEKVETSAEQFIEEFSDDDDDDDESDFSDDEMYIDDYDDWNDCSVASHGVTGEQGMASHPNRQVKPENKIKKYLS